MPVHHVHLVHPAFVGRGSGDEGIPFENGAMIMADLAEWIAAKLSGAGLKGQLVSPPVAVAGAGERVLLTFGPDEKKVIYLAIRHGGGTMRVGFAAKDRWTNEEIEEAVESNGGTMTEFLEDEMEADDDLEYEVQHFHEAGWFHFASDIPKDAGFFGTDAGRELVWYYFAGYCRAILPIVSKAD